MFEKLLCDNRHFQNSGFAIKVSDLNDIVSDGRKEEMGRKSADIRYGQKPIQHMLEKCKNKNARNVNTCSARVLGSILGGLACCEFGFHEALIGNRAEGRSGQLRQNVTKLQIIGRDLV